MAIYGKQPIADQAEDLIENFVQIGFGQSVFVQNNRTFVVGKIRKVFCIQIEICHHGYATIIVIV